MHKNEFWILTNKCGNILKHENEAEYSHGYVLVVRYLPERSIVRSIAYVTMMVYFELHTYLTYFNFLLTVTYSVLARGKKFDILLILLTMLEHMVVIVRHCIVIHSSGKVLQLSDSIF